MHRIQNLQFHILFEKIPTDLICSANHLPVTIKYLYRMANSLGSALIGNQSDAKALDRRLMDVDPVVIYFYTYASDT